MEKDDELKGGGNSYDFGARMYDSRVGRWLTIDAMEKKYPSINPYATMDNNPIINVDMDGNEPVDPPDGKLYIFHVWQDENNKRCTKIYQVKTVTGLKSDIIKSVYLDKEGGQGKIVDYYLRNPDGTKGLGMQGFNVGIDKMPTVKELNAYFGDNLKEETPSEKSQTITEQVYDIAPILKPGYFEGGADPANSATGYSGVAGMRNGAEIMDKIGDGLSYIPTPPTQVFGKVFQGQADVLNTIADYNDPNISVTDASKNFGIRLVTFGVGESVGRHVKNVPDGLNKYIFEQSSRKLGDTVKDELIK